MGIPCCCKEPLTQDFSIPGFEFRCEVCGALYQFFDGFTRIEPERMTKRQIKLAKERGYIISATPDTTEGDTK